LGNTPRIALKHYLMTTETDFQRAMEGGAKFGAHKSTFMAHNAAQPSSAASRQAFQETHKALNNQGLCHVLADVGKQRQESLVAGTGFEPATSRL
jgi:hypothetical protein